MKYFLYISLLAGLLVSFISGCSADMELIPVGEVTIYKNIKGDEVLGFSSTPLKVENLVYPDKTDYVVEVSYQGKRGYVRDGQFRISKK